MSVPPIQKLQSTGIAFAITSFIRFVLYIGQKYLFWDENNPLRLDTINGLLLDGGPAAFNTSCISTNCFTLRGPNKTVYLESDFQDQRDRWLAELFQLVPSIVPLTGNVLVDGDYFIAYTEDADPFTVFVGFDEKGLLV